MKLYIIFVYMIFSGMVGGLVHNVHHEKCHTKGFVSTSDVIGAILWPMALGYAITIDDDKLKTTECGSE